MQRAGAEPTRDHKRRISRVPLLGTNQAERFFSERAMGEGVTAEYAEGWDDSLFAEHWVLDQIDGRPPVVLPVAMMSNLELKLGDGVWLQNSKSTRSMDCTVAGRYVGTGFGWEAPILVPLSLLETIEARTRIVLR